MQKFDNKLQKGINQVFIGLMLIVLAIDLFTIFNISSLYIMKFLGTIFIILAILKLKNVSKNFKISFVLNIVLLLTVIGLVTLQFILPIANINTLINDGAKELITEEYFNSEYILAIVGAIENIITLLLIYFLLKGIYDYCEIYINSISDEAKTRSKRFLIFGGIYHLLSIVQLILIIPQFNAYNKLVEAGGFELDTTKGEFISGQEAYGQYVADTMKVSVVSIVFGIYLIVYLISMVRTLSLISRISRIKPSDPSSNAYYDTLNSSSREIKSEKEDDWSNDFR